MTLHKQTADRIEKDAAYYVRYGKPKIKTKTEAKYLAYIAGATAEALLSQQLQEQNSKLRKALEEIEAYQPDLLASKARIIREMKGIATEALKKQP